MRLSGGAKLLIIKTKVSKVEVGTLRSAESYLSMGSTTNLSFILTPVIDKKITNTEANFLISYNTCLHHNYFYQNYNI